MKQVTILSLIMLACVSQQVSADHLYNVVVTWGSTDLAAKIVFDELDDGMTFRELADLALERWGVNKDTEVRLESHFGLSYDMNKTLKEAGIEEGTRIKLKSWSRAKDIAAALRGDRMFV